VTATAYSFAFSADALFGAGVAGGGVTGPWAPVGGAMAKITTMDTAKAFTDGLTSGWRRLI